MKHVILRSMLFFASLLLAGMAQAQTVSGTVSEPNGPLPGANVLVKGTTNGTTTDFDGNYTLNDVATGSVLVFSYVGFAPQEVAVNGRSTVNVTLQEDAAALDEVVLIGYGSTTVKDATGTVASVTSEDFNQGVIASPEQLIQGKTAGVQISQSSGEPGAGINVRIRGSNSIRSGNNPLIVVDGVPLTTSGAPAAGDLGVGGGSSRNPLSFLNPTDIESISILKDASATAIYGSRGANGVIIVQTKSGRGSSGGVWEVSSNVSFSSPAREYDLLTADQYLNALPDYGGDPSLLDFGFASDFQDFYTRNAISTQNNLSYAHSYTSGNVRASFGYSDQQGVIRNTGQERITGRLNATQRLFDDKLTLSLQTTLSRVNDQNAPISGQAGSTGDLIGSSITANPTWPVDADFSPGSNLLNPVNLLRYYQSESNTNRFLANLSAEYKITDAISAKVTGGYDKSDAKTIALFSPDVAGINRVSGNGQGTYGTFDQTNKLFEATVSYNKQFENSKIDVVAGYSYQEFAREGINAGGIGFGSDMGLAAQQLEDQYGLIANTISGSFQNFAYDQNRDYVNRIDFGAPFDSAFVSEPIGTNYTQLFTAYFANTFDNTDELQSYFARVNYTLADKYLFTGTFRADGSSTFGPENQYGYFPSGAFAWQIHEEDFIGDNVSTLKLRLGAGIVGNQEGLGYANFIRRTRFSDIGITDNLTVTNSGTQFVGNNNEALQWESTLDVNVGVDFGFNNDRFNGSFNLYRKETTDLLLLSTLAAPQVPGIETIFQNLTDGKVVNQGVELALNYDFVQTEDFTFSSSFNIAYNHNEVLDTDRIIDTGPINGNGLTGAFAQRLQAGQPLFSFYMAEFTGFDENGNPTYVDVDGNGEGDPDADKKFVGEDAQPDWTAGLSLNATYKNFDFAAYFNGQFGFSVYNATDNAFFNAGGITIAKNVTTDVLTSGEAPGSSVAVSTRFLEKGDFVRLQTLSVGYNVPMSGEGLFDSLRFSVTGQNVFLITGYSGLDPEVSTNTGSLNASNIPTAGIEYAAFPRPRTFTLGVNARF